jgi:hypothetical protein
LITFAHFGFYKEGKYANRFIWIYANQIQVGMTKASITFYLRILTPLQSSNKRPNFFTPATVQLKISRALTVNVMHQKISRIQNGLNLRVSPGRVYFRDLG